MPDFPLSPPHHEPEHSNHAIFARPGAQREQAPKKPGSIGTADDVVDAFMGGTTKKSRATHVPGGRRMRAEPSQDEPGAHDLFSYRTVIARRHADESISVTPKKYSTTTSKAQGRLQRRMIEHGYEPSGETRQVRADVPGRWGGFGPAWHATGWEDLPFVHHRKKA